MAITMLLLFDALVTVFLFACISTIIIIIITTIITAIIGRVCSTTSTPGNLPSLVSDADVYVHNDDNNCDHDNDNSDCDNHDSYKPLLIYSCFMILIIIIIDIMFSCYCCVFLSLLLC